MKSFSFTNEFGKVAEEKVRAYYERRGYKVTPARAVLLPEMANGYDFVVSKENETFCVEVKRDGHIESGSLNFCFEMYGENKPKGLLSGSNGVFVIVAKNVAWFFDRKRLIHFLLRNQKYWTINECVHDVRAFNVLFPICLLEALLEPDAWKKQRVGELYENRLDCTNFEILEAGTE